MEKNKLGPYLYAKIGTKLASYSFLDPMSPYYCIADLALEFAISLKSKIISKLESLVSE